MLKKIWNDDCGALLSAEWVFLATIMVIGLVAGMVQVRNAVTGELAEIAGAVSALDQSYGYSGLTSGTNNCCFVAGTAVDDNFDPRILASTVLVAPFNIDNNICE